MAHKDITLDLTKHPFGPAVIFIIKQLRRRLRDYVNLRPGLGHEVDAMNLSHLIDHPDSFSWRTVEQAVKRLERSNDGPHAIKDCGVDELAASKTIPEMLDISDDVSTEEAAGDRLVGLIEHVFEQVEKQGLVNFGNTTYVFNQVVGEGDFEQSESFTLIGLTRGEETDGEIEIAAENSEGEEITFALDEVSLETLAEAWDHLQEMTPVGD